MPTSKTTKASARISACVITLNEADRIEACLQSLAFCDEIVVVDSGSTDGTADLATALGARVLQRAFDGYRSQKEFAVRAAQHDWVLCLDADERVTPALRAAIEAARAEDFPASGYRFARATEYFGAFLRHGNAYPDRVLRLTAATAAFAASAKFMSTRASTDPCRRWPATSNTAPIARCRISSRAWSATRV